jgi:hypothetical protein
MGALTPGVKLTTDIHLVQRLKMNEASTPPYVFMAWCLVKHRIHLTEWYFVKYRDNFTLTLPAITSRTALEPTQPPIQWILGALSLGVNRSEPEAGHSPPSSAEIKE